MTLIVVCGAVCFVVYLKSVFTRGHALNIHRSIDESQLQIPLSESEAIDAALLAAERSRYCLQNDEWGVRVVVYKDQRTSFVRNSLNTNSGMVYLR